MADTGWKPFTSARSDSSGAGVAIWVASSGTLASALAAEDAAYAGAGNVSAGSSTNWLVGHAPDLSSIPDTATINGIEYRVKAQSASDGTTWINGLYHRKTTTNGANVGSNLAATPQSMPNPAAIRTFGGASDLGGTTWTPAELKAAGYGVALKGQNFEGKIESAPRVDLLECRVTYTEASDPLSVTGIAPSSGSTAGGTAVTITGTGFEAGATVTIGGASATSVVVVSETSITCVTPSGTAGAKDVVVTNPDGGFSGTLAGGFTYAAGGPSAAVATGVSRQGSRIGIGV